MAHMEYQFHMGHVLSTVDFWLLFFHAGARIRTEIRRTKIFCPAIERRRNVPPIFLRDYAKRPIKWARESAMETRTPSPRTFWRTRSVIFLSDSCSRILFWRSFRSESRSLRPFRLFFISFSLPAHIADAHSRIWTSFFLSRPRIDLCIRVRT